MNSEKDKDYKRLNNDLQELLLNYKESSLTPGEFCHQIVFVIARLATEIGCCLHSTTMLLQDALTTGICEGLSKLHPDLAHNPNHEHNDD
jgi:hypothetical protein